MILCLKWHDYRLMQMNPVIINTTNSNQALHYPSVKLTQLSRFWLPRIYFRNGLSTDVTHSLRDIQYVEVRPATKMVNWCSRLNVQTTCHFNLSNFPFDAQDCFYELESCKYISICLILSFAFKVHYKLTDFTIFTFIFFLFLSLILFFYYSVSNLRQHMRIKLTHIESETGGNYQFRLHHSWNGSCLPQTLDPFSDHRIHRLVNVDGCAFGAVRLVRHLGYYVIRYYATTFLCVVTSYCSFWVATNGWPARVIFTCVVYVTVKGISETAYDEVPTNDVVSLFWWLWFMQCFVYMNLVEYATALAWVQFAEDKNRAHAAGVVSV